MRQKQKVESYQNAYYEANVATEEDLQACLHETIAGSYHDATVAASGQEEAT